MRSLLLWEDVRPVLCVARYFKVAQRDRVEGLIQLHVRVCLVIKLLAVLQVLGNETEESILPIGLRVSSGNEIQLLGRSFQANRERKF